MRWLPWVAWILPIWAGHTPGTAIDASAVRADAAIAVAKPGLLNLESERRDMCWSLDRGELYVKTAAGNLLIDFEG